MTPFEGPFLMKEKARAVMSGRTDVATCFMAMATIAGPAHAHGNPGTLPAPIGCQHFRTTWLRANTTATPTATPTGTPAATPSPVRRRRRLLVGDPMLRRFVFRGMVLPAWAAALMTSRLSKVIPTSIYVGLRLVAFGIDEQRHDLATDF